MLSRSHEPRHLSAPLLDEPAEDWAPLFAPGDRLVALPAWDRPRVLVPAGTLTQRWQGSAFYPAFRPAARTYRLLLRLKTLGGLGAVQVTSRSPSTCLADFLEDVLPQARVQAIIVGMPGATQKLTARLADPDGKVIGYLKCARKPLARRRLQHEYELLCELPSGIAPMPLKLGVVADLDVLLLTAVRGRQMRPALPPPVQLAAFADSLATHATASFDRHPWVSEAMGCCCHELEGSFEALSRRDWPIVRQHGDLTPWNLLQTAEGSLVAVDWEYGRVAGFPGLDLAHYVLQAACLFHRWSPAEARNFARCYLVQDRWLDLSPAEAAAIVSLAAHEAFQLEVANGHVSNDPTQRWRRAIWERAG